MEMTSTELTAFIKKESQRIGFSDCGISKSEKLVDHEERLSQYLESGFHGEMLYLENHFEKRLNPTVLEEGTKSIVSLLINYYPEKQQIDPKAPVIAKYAYGKDYHFVVKDMMTELLESIQNVDPSIHGRCFVDSAPVLERAWAVKSGLGWIGKNGNLISRTFGSFVFIAELLLNIELEYDAPLEKEYCGKCTRCTDACPTNAICSSKIVDGSKCISYLTIEYRGDIMPDSFKGKLQNRLFGCDICQDVCPHNRKAKPHSMKQFSPKPQLLNLTSDQWFSIDANSFSPLMTKSAFKRTKFRGIARNLDFLQDDD